MVSKRVVGCGIIRVIHKTVAGTKGSIQHGLNDEAVTN